MKPALMLVILAALSSPAAAASCVLVVDGTSYIDGLCEFRPLDGGDFQIMAGDYFAYVYPSTKPVTGYWNGAERSLHAHDPLGELTRQGACWVNDTAKVCAVAE